MSLVNVPITIPTDTTASAAQAVGSVGGPMTLSVKGTENDSFIIDVAGTALAFDSPDWTQMCVVNVGPSGSVVLNASNWNFANAQLSYWRIRRTVGTTAMVVNLSGPPNTQATGPAGAPSNGYATVYGTATLDAGGSPAARVVAQSPSIGDGSYIISGVLSVYNATDLSNRSFVVDAAFKVAGGTASAIGTITASGLGEALAVTVTHAVSGSNLGIYATGIATKVIRATFAGCINMVA